MWHPEPLQSTLPIGMWLFGVLTIVTLRKVPATEGAWQFTQVVTPLWVLTTEYEA